jgi:hypothetical protein
MGELSDMEIFELFGELIKTWQAWTLQGHYGRTAKVLIEQGFIDEKGNVLTCDE